MNKQKVQYVVKGSEEAQQAKEAIEKKDQEKKEQQQQEEQKEQKKPSKNNNNNKNRRPQNKNDRNDRNNNNNNNNNKYRNNNNNRNRNNNNNKKRSSSQSSDDSFKPRRRHNKKYDFNWRNVSLETEIPAVPENIQKPDKQKYYKEIDALDDKITALYETKNKIIEDILNEKKESIKKNMDDQGPLKDRLIKIKEERKTKRQAWLDAKNVFSQVESKVQALNLKKDELMSKMNLKNAMSYDKLHSEIEKLKDDIYFHSNTKMEENTKIKRLEKLEAALPLAEPLEDVEEQIYKLQYQYKGERKKMNYHFAMLKEVQKEEQALQDELTGQKDFIRENKTNLKPLIEEKKKEQQVKIDELKQKKLQLKKDFEKKIEAYEDHLELLDYVEFLKRQMDILKERARKQKEWEAKQAKKIQKQKEWEERQKAEKERRKQERLLRIPFYEELDTIKLLNEYCNRLIRENNQKQEKSNEQTQDSQEKQVNLDEKTLQKEKLTLVEKKKATDDFMTGVQKTKKSKKQNQQKQELKQEQNNNIVHHYEVIKQFDSMNVSPPQTIDNLAKTLEILQEKKAYFEEQQKLEQERREKSDYESSDDEGHEQDRERDNRRGEHRQQDNEHQHKRKHNKKKIDTSNAEEFPEF